MRVKFASVLAVIALSGVGLAAPDDELEDVFITKQKPLGGTSEHKVWTEVGYCTTRSRTSEKKPTYDNIESAAACWDKCEDDLENDLIAINWRPEGGGSKFKGKENGLCWCKKAWECECMQLFEDKGPSTAVVITRNITGHELPEPCKAPRWYPRYETSETTCPYTRGCPDKAPELCAPKCNYDYKYRPHRMRTIVHRQATVFGIIAACLLVICLGSRALYRSVWGEDVCATVCTRKDKVFSVKLDRLQVAASLIKRLETIASMSSRLVGFTSFVIASGAIRDQREFSAFREYNMEYILGYLFLMFSFLLFLLCNFVAATLVLQIKEGYVTGLTAFATRVFEVLNLIGVLCFVQATMEFQSTVGWSDFPHDFVRPPQILGWSFMAVYSAFWMGTFFNVGDLWDEWAALGGWRYVNMKPFKSTMRDHDIFKHFNCKPLGDPPLGSCTKPMYAISVVPSTVETPLAVARARDHTKVVELLEDAVAKRLNAAAKDGDVEEITRLLDGGAKINAATDGATPLWVAAEAGHYKAVELLLGRGADVGAIGSRPAEKGKGSGRAGS